MNKILLIPQDFVGTRIDRWIKKSVFKIWSPNNEIIRKLGQIKYKCLQPSYKVELIIITQNKGSTKDEKKIKS